MRNLILFIDFGDSNRKMRFLLQAVTICLMRILQINSAKNFGGGERHLVDLVQGLRGKGHQIFVALRQEAKWQGKLQIPSEKLFFLPLRNAFDVLSAWRLAKFIKREKIEVVHAHLARDYYLAALAVRFAPSAKFVLTRHLLFPLNGFQRLALKNLAKAIAVSHGVAASLQVNKVVENDKIAVIYNGVNVEKFRLATTDSAMRNAMRREFAPENELLIGTIGELRAHKGHEEFIRAAAMVAKKFETAKFLVVGADNSRKKEYSKHLQQLAEDLHLPEKIIFTGWRDDLPSIYAGLDVFVSSARSEPFGLVLAEAMVSGCAIVATETVGAKEVLVDNGEKCAKIVEVGNVEKLAEAVVGFLSDENLRRRFGKLAQKSAVARFDQQRMIDETEKVYLEVLAKSA